MEIALFVLLYEIKSRETKGLSMARGQEVHRAVST